MKKTIKKVLDELAKDKPDLSYIRGLLEVLIDDDDIPNYSAIVTKDRNGKPIPPVKVYTPRDKELVIDEATVKNNVDEGALLEAEAVAKLASIKKLADESVQEN